MTDPKQQRIWDTTAEAHRRIMGGELNALLKSLPNSGKTFGRGMAAAEIDEPITTLQPNLDLRAETARKYEEHHGLDNLDLPSFVRQSRLCDEDDPAYDERAEEWHGREMPPRLIGELLGKPEDDEYFGTMADDWSDRDSLTGDPAHKALRRAVADRHVALDDVDAYGTFVDEHSLNDEATRRAVQEYLRQHRDRLPDEDAWADWGRILNPDEEMAAAMWDVAENEPSELDIPDTDYVTGSTDAVVRAIARRGEEAVWVEFDAGGSEIRHIAARVVHEGEDDVVHMSLPVHLGDARSVTLMTATPVYPIFRRVFEDLDVASQIVDSVPAEHRESYFNDVLELDIVQSTEALKPVSGCNNVRPDEFRVLVEDVIERHGEKPLVISSKKAIEAGEEAVESDNEPTRGRVGTAKDGLADAIEEYGLEAVNFRRAIGTNEFAGAELAVIWGCPHYGDGYVKRAAAICGDTGAEAVRFVDGDGEPVDPEVHDGEAERVETRWTTETAQEIYENMTEGAVLQAAMRVGRSTDAQATVYAHTSAVPDDVPRTKPEGGEMVHTFTAGETEVMEAGREAPAAFTVRQLVRRVSVSRSTVYRAVERFIELGMVEPAGSGDWGAQEYRAAFEQAADTPGGVPKVVSDLLDRVLMEKRNRNTYHEPEIDDRTGVFTRSGMTEPDLLELEMADETQTTLPVDAGPPRASADGDAGGGAGPPGEQTGVGDWGDPR